MFFTIPSHLSNDAAAYWDRQYEVCSALQAKTLSGMTKLADLNMRALQDAVHNATTASQHLLSSDHAAATQQGQLAREAAREYGRQVAGLASEMRTAYTQLLQGNITSTSAQIEARLDELAKTTPDSASGVIEAVRTTLGNVHKGYDQLMMTSEQAAQAVVDSLDVRAQPFVPAPPKKGTRAAAH
jgi:hypothetical protein